MIRVKLQTVLLMPVLFLCTGYLYAANFSKECEYLFKFKIFNTTEPSFQTSLQQVTDLRGYTRMFKEGIKRVHEDRQILMKYFSDNRNSLTKEEIHVIYKMLSLLNYQLIPISLRLPSIPMEALGKIAWVRQEVDNRAKDTYAWDIKYLWERFSSVYAQLSELKGTTHFTKKDKIKPSKKRSNRKEGINTRQPVVTTSIGGHKGESSIYGGRFSLVAVWTHVIEYTDNIFLELVKDIYLKYPGLSKIIPDFESVYIYQQTDLLPLGIIKKYLIPYIRSGVGAMVDKMNISEYVEFLEVVLGKKILEEFLMPEEASLVDPRIYFITSFNGEYDRNIKPLNDRILEEARDLQLDSFSDVKVAIGLLDVVDEIVEKLKLPKEINQDLLSLILAIDIWQMKTGGNPWEIVNEIYEEFFKLDSFSRAYFINYLLKSYQEKDKIKMLEVFSKRVLVDGRDKINRRMVEKLILPVLKSYDNQDTIPKGESGYRVDEEDDM